MDLEFDTNQSELRRSVRSVLDKECPASLPRQVVESGASWDGLWKQMADLSWLALTVPEELGGLGLGFVELAVVLEELGKSLAGGPFLPTTTGFLASLREAGTSEQQARWCPLVGEGALTGSLAVLDHTNAWSAGGVGLIARREDGWWVLDGVKRHVVEGAAVDELVVAARLAGTSGEDGIALFVVPRRDITATPSRSLDRTREVATVELLEHRVPPDRVLGQPGQAGRALVRAMDESALGLALESVGTCQAIFDLALEHVKSRRQFGVPVGSFQAMKHKFADMLVALERARAVAYMATGAVAEDDDTRALLVPAAKAAAADAQRTIAQEGIQALGGIGYTWEHDMHLYVKRAKASAALFGGRRESLDRVAAKAGLGPPG